MKYALLAAVAALLVMMLWGSFRRFRRKREHALAAERSRREVERKFQDGSYVADLAPGLAKGLEPAWSLCLSLIAAGDRRSLPALSESLHCAPPRYRSEVIKALVVMGEYALGTHRRIAGTSSTASFVAWAEIYLEKGRWDRFPLDKFPYVEPLAEQHCFELLRLLAARRMKEEALRLLLQSAGWGESSREYSHHAVLQLLEKQPVGPLTDWWSTVLSEVGAATLSRDAAIRERKIANARKELIAFEADPTAAEAFLSSHQSSGEWKHPLRGMELLTKYFSRRAPAWRADDAECDRLLKLVPPWLFAELPQSLVTEGRALAIFLRCIAEGNLQVLCQLVKMVRSCGHVVTWKDCEEKKCPSCEGKGETGGFYDAPLERDCYPGYPCELCDSSGGTVCFTLAVQEGPAGRPREAPATVTMRSWPSVRETFL